MNKVILNEYLLEGVGEMKSLLAHEVHVFFKRFPQRLSFQRKSNTQFLIQDKTKGQIEVSYEYLVDKDVWEVNVNNTTHIIENGRSKSVTKISYEMIKHILS